MLKLISDTYKMFFKNFPVILLYAAPLLLLSGITTWIGNNDQTSQGAYYFYYLALIAIPLISVATDIALYRRFFGYSIISPLASPKAFALYLVTQLALGLVASAPIILIDHIMMAIGVSYYMAFVIAIFVNMFIGIYLIARFSVLMALIVQNKVPSLKEFSYYTAKTYKGWMAVAFLVYGPYIVLNYGLVCPILNAVLTNLIAFIFVCFNVKYVSAYRVPTAKITAAKVKVKTTAVAAPEKVEIKKTAQKKKAETPKKNVTTKKTTAARKTTAKTPAATKKVPAAKKTAAAKKVK